MEYYIDVYLYDFYFDGFPYRILFAPPISPIQLGSSQPFSFGGVTTINPSASVFSFGSSSSEVKCGLSYYICRSFACCIHHIN